MCCWLEQSVEINAHSLLRPVSDLKVKISLKYLQRWKDLLVNYLTRNSTLINYVSCLNIGELCQNLKKTIIHQCNNN